MKFFSLILFILCLVYKEMIFATSDTVVDLGYGRSPLIIVMNSKTECSKIPSTSSLHPCLCCLMYGSLFKTTPEAITQALTTCAERSCATQISALDELYPRTGIGRFNPTLTSAQKNAITTSLNTALQERNLIPVVFPDSLISRSDTSSKLQATRGKLSRDLVIQLLRNLVAQRQLTAHADQITSERNCLDVTSVAGGAQTLQLFIVKTAVGCPISTATVGKILFVIKEPRRSLEEIKNIERLKRASLLTRSSTHESFIANEGGNANRIGIALTYANAVYASPATSLLRSPEIHYLTISVPAAGVPAKSLLDEFARMTAPDRVTRAPRLRKAFQTFGRYLAQLHESTKVAGSNDSLGASSLVHGDLHLENAFIEVTETTDKVTLIDAETMALSVDHAEKSSNDLIRLMAHTTSHFVKSDFIGLQTPETWADVFIRPFLRGYIQYFHTDRRKIIANYLVRTFSDASIFKLFREQGTVYNPTEWDTYKRIILETLRTDDILGEG